MRVQAAQPHEPLGAVAARLDELVDGATGIDRFCSSTDWIVPLHATIGGGEVVATVSDRAAVALTTVGIGSGRRLLCGLDTSWGYACPLAGDPGEAVGLLDEALGAAGTRVDGALVSGVAPGSALADALVEHFGGRLLGVASPTGRCVASLEGGAAAFLARRSQTFRRNLRQAARRAGPAGLSLHWYDGGGPDLVDRAVAAERASWKGRRHSGLAEPGFAAFYRAIAARLEPAGRLRVGFARLAGSDVGYILGAVRGDTYRGLQLSYAEHVAPMSVGNLLQAGQIERLGLEGITRYDLGQDIAYKHAWSDALFVTDTYVVAARAARRPGAQAGD